MSRIRQCGLRSIVRILGIRCALRSLIGLLALGTPLLQATADDKPGERVAVPDAAARAEANKRIVDLFKNDLAQAKSAGDKTVLAEHLLSQAAETPDDLPARYVLCNLARDLAVAAGDSRIALQAIDELAVQFDVDFWDLRAQALADASSHLPTDAARQVWLQILLSELDAALNAEQFAAVGKLAGLLQAAAGRQKDPELKKHLQARLADVKKLKQQAGAAKQARKTLETKPDDPPANLALGKYLCLLRGDWQQGLPHLARGGTNKLAALARQDTAANVPPEELVKIADAYFDLAAAESGAAKRSLAEHAQLRYGEAQKRSTGLVKMKADKRIAQCIALLNELQSNSRLPIAAGQPDDAPPPANQPRPAALSAGTGAGADLQRAIAERLLALDVHVRVVVEGQPGVYLKERGLPAEPFKIEWISFDDRVAVNDADCEVLAKLTDLANLSIYGSPITDNGLARLCKIKSLTNLQLSKSRITDRGLGELKALPNLKLLDLGSTQITSAGMPRVAEVPTLELLTLFGTRVDNAGLKSIAQLANLKVLNIGQLPISDAGLAPLAGMRHLEAIYASHCPLTFENFPRGDLAESLRFIGADHTQISDAGIKSLVAAAPKLQVLDASHGEVSKAGIQNVLAATDLRTLIIVDTKVGPGDLEPLKDLPNLRVLRVSVGVHGAAEFLPIRQARPGIQIDEAY